MDRPWLYDATLVDWIIVFAIGIFAFAVLIVIEHMDKELTRRIEQLEVEIKKLTGKELQ